jgi:tRNA(adenine34) deaminase
VCWCLIESNIKNCFWASDDEHRGFVKMGTQLHQKRRKTGCLAEEASDLMKRFCY